MFAQAILGCRALYWLSLSCGLRGKIYCGYRHDAQIGGLDYRDTNVVRQEELSRCMKKENRVKGTNSTFSMYLWLLPWSRTAFPSILYWSLSQVYGDCQTSRNSRGHPLSMGMVHPRCHADLAGQMRRRWHLRKIVSPAWSPRAVGTRPKTTNSMKRLWIFG